MFPQDLLCNGNESGDLIILQPSFNVAYVICHVVYGNESGDRFFLVIKQNPPNPTRTFVKVKIQSLSALSLLVKKFPGKFADARKFGALV